MFGLLRPARLEGADRLQHRRLYCGLCQSTGQQQGLALRALHSHDAVLMATLAEALALDEAPASRTRCPMLPIVHRPGLGGDEQTRRRTARAARLRGSPGSGRVAGCRGDGSAECGRRADRSGPGARLRRPGRSAWRAGPGRAGPEGLGRGRRVQHLHHRRPWGSARGRGELAIRRAEQAVDARPLALWGRVGARLASMGCSQLPNPADNEPAEGAYHLDDCLHDWTCGLPGRVMESFDVCWAGTEPHLHDLKRVWTEGHHGSVRSPKRPAGPSRVISSTKAWPWASRR